MQFTFTLQQLLIGVISLATAISSIIGAWKILSPALKLTGRVKDLEDHKDNIIESIERMREECKIADRLLVRAMVEIIDNRLTDNNHENLRITKEKLNDFLQTN